MMAIKGRRGEFGSACTSASLEPSPCSAPSASATMAHSSIRFGLGRWTTEEEVDYVANLVIDKVKHLAQHAPLYEMYKDGIDPQSVQWVAH